MTTNWGNLC